MASRAVFAGYDTNNQRNLWVTDGTAAGTSELAVAGVLHPDFTVLGGRVLFDGNSGLWVTDGTAAGTSELAAAVGFAGLNGFEDPGPEFTVLGGKALFDGEDASGNFNLWVTDGTVAGTSELIVAGAYSNGGLFSHLNQAQNQVTPNPDFTVLGSKALFVGADANDDYNLYVTNGTSAGTSELTVAGAYSGGLFYYQFTDGPHFAALGSKAVFVGTAAGTTGEGSLWVTDGTSAGTSELIAAGANANGLDPRGNFAVLGNKALFLGFGQDRGASLWVTNGTSAGTSELTVAGADSSDGLTPQYITVFGSKALFSGAGASGLWVTDGTSAGTSELTVAGAYIGGLSPQQFTVFGSKVLFSGEDASKNFNLWITDGTSAGTKELTSGAVSPGGITVLGNEALFAGERMSIWTDLWVTDGTVAGTRKLAVAGAYSSGLTPTDITALPPPPPPAPSGLALAAGSDSGVKGDDLTNVTKPVITGKGVAGDTVTLYDGTTAIGTATVPAGGTWSVTPTSALAAGVHSLTATETGATGTSAASAALKLTIKTAVAVPSGLSFAVAADEGASGDTMTVAGKGEARDTVTLYDGTTAIGTGTVAAAGTWSITTASALKIGAHSLTTSEVDAAGNTSPASPAQSITIDSVTPNAVVFIGTAGADNFTGGADNDTFEFSVANLAASDRVVGGGGTNTLVMTTPGTVARGGVSGVEVYDLANGGANSLTLSNANFTGVTNSSITINGGNSGNTVNASGLTGANRVIAFGGAGTDDFTGGAGNDYFYFSVANLAASDTVSGGAGTNYLVMTTPGTVARGGVSGVEVYDLANGGANSLTLSNANFTGVTGNSITINGGDGGNTVNASALTGANRVVAVGGAGKDVFTGGAGNDVFHFSAANLAASDTVSGGAGTNYLVMTTPGPVARGGVSGVEVYDLANGGANSLTLANANFTGVTGSSITINGGNDGNTVNASGLTGADSIVVHAGTGADTLTGGPGSDVFYAGGDTKMTGGAGANQFTFSAVGSNTIADFTASATNEIVFSNSGFALGLSGATATPQTLPAGLFVSDSAGTFTATTQRFAYGTSNGELFYSASGTTVGDHLVVTLTGHPTLAASSLHYIS